MLFTIKSKRTNPFHEVYASDECNTLSDCLAQWFFRRKEGKKAFTRRQELEIAVRVGAAMSWPGSSHEVDAFGDTLVIEYRVS